MTVAKNAPPKDAKFPGEPALIADTESQGKPLNELGWAHGNPSGVNETRDYLAANNGGEAVSADMCEPPSDHVAVR